VIWNIFEKSMKEIGKIEKEKGERKRINKRAPRKPFGPTPEASRGPVANPKRYPSVLSLPR
jgi:hypothetical protein